MLLFDLNEDPTFGKALAAALDVPVAPHELRRFEDGECKQRPLTDPCGADVYLLQSLHGDRAHGPHDRLLRLLMFAATLREHGAARVTAVLPYLAYARKDRRTQGFDPNSLRYVAQLVEAVGVTQVIALEVHNPAAFENAFRCTTQPVASRPAFDPTVLAWAAVDPLAVVSPDPGGVKRAQLWHEALESRVGHPLGFAFCDKRRSGGQLGGTDLVAGKVRGMTAVLVDDLIVSGQTLRRAALALREVGASRVVACAAHGLFSDAACAALGDDAVSEVVVGDGVPWPGPAGSAPWQALRQKVRTASCVQPMAEAVRRSHEGWRR